jgi:nitrogenase subunit NifH
VDVGGDAAGAVVLGMFADKIKAHRYEMIYVINKYRPLIADIANAVNMARAIEEKSKLKISSIINNSNIGEFTTEADILATFDYARKISEELNVPRLANTAFINAKGTSRINNYTRKIF